MKNLSVFNVMTNFGAQTASEDIEMSSFYHRGSTIQHVHIKRERIEICAPIDFKTVAMFDLLYTNYLFCSFIKISIINLPKSAPQGTRELENRWVF